jgi:hypothetical protein
VTVQGASMERGRHPSRRRAGPCRWAGGAPPPWLPGALALVAPPDGRPRRARFPFTVTATPTRSLIPRRTPSSTSSATWSRSSTTSASPRCCIFLHVKQSGGVCSCLRLLPTVSDCRCSSLGTTGARWWRGT